MPPEICVLIPCFNNLPGLKKALRSIFYKPGGLTVLVVDDGSREPLQSDQLVDVNLGFELEILRLPENAGITKALNAGLKWILKQKQFQYIARLDCGDECASNRFFEQVSFLDNNPKVALLGTWCTFKNPVTGFAYTYTTPTRHDAIVKELYYRNVFIHPTVMFRTTVLDKIGFYPEHYEHVEDYAFFMKIARAFKTAVLPKYLVTCEINPKGISIANRRKQLKGRAQVVSDFGKSPILKMFGLFRLQLLQMIPYQFILLLKKTAGRSIKA